METLTGPLADALARHRRELNARFATRQQNGGGIDGNSFLHHLATTVDPIVRAVDMLLPERADAVAVALYDISLELFATKWLGPQPKNTTVRDAWQGLLPQVPMLIAREPARLAGSISNAIIHLASTPGARAPEWLLRLTAIAPRCPTVTTLLQCGNVLAWLAGMAQFRAGALDTARRLEPSLATATFGLADDVAADNLATMFERLRGDPWLTPAEAIGAAASSGKLSIVRQAGGFRGFGGPFLRPPTVTHAASDFFVSDGEKQWGLAADAFGAVFVRVEPLKRTNSKSNATIESNGLLRWDGQTAIFPELTGASSIAGDDRTLAITLATSHLVFLVAKKQ